MLMADLPSRDGSQPVGSVHCVRPWQLSRQSLTLSHVLPLLGIICWCKFLTPCAGLMRHGSSTLVCSISFGAPCPNLPQRQRTLAS